MTFLFTDGPGLGFIWEDTNYFSWYKGDPVSTTLADIESQVFYEISEADAAYGGSYWQEYDVDELRDALGDAIDELAMKFDFFKYEVVIPLVENVGFYSVSMEGAYPFYIKRARIWKSDRRLQPDTLLGLSKQDKKFLISRGSPMRYVPLASDLILLWPIPEDSGDLIKIEVIGTPSHYDVYNQYIKIREEFEQALVHYGKYFLLMHEGGGFLPALEEYLEYLRIGGFANEFKYHQRLLQKARFKDGSSTWSGRE